MKLWVAAVVGVVLQSAIGVRRSESPFPDCRPPAGGCAQSHSVWDGVYTAGQARRGQAIYSAQCASCHGVLLDGIDTAPALMGGGFLGQWDGVNLADMVERIRVSMPLDNPGSLGRHSVVHVLAYLLSVNGMPPGDAELSAEPARLSQIVFRAAKPGPDGR